MMDQKQICVFWLKQMSLDGPETDLPLAHLNTCLDGPETDANDKRVLAVKP